MRLPWQEVTRFCVEHGTSRSRFYEIRAETAGKPLTEVLTSRPRRSRPDRAIGADVAAAALKIRKDLENEGLDAGPLTVGHELAVQGFSPVPPRARLARLFSASGAVTPQPQKRPRSSYRRFAFAYVHECWQLDATEVVLAEGSKAVVFQVLDDHSRFVVASRAAAPENATEITWDRGSELAAYERIQMELGSTLYFCDPYSQGPLAARHEREHEPDAAALVHQGHRPLGPYRRRARPRPGQAQYSTPANAGLPNPSHEAERATEHSSVNQRVATTA